MTTDISFVSLISALQHPVVATLFAGVGIALGLAICKMVRFQTGFLAAGAIGVLLAVILYNALPAAKQFLNWPGFVAGCASGYLLLWVIGSSIYRVAPVQQLREGARYKFSRIAVLLGIIFVFYAALNGISIVFGDNLLGRPDLELLFEGSVHKIPEGLALILFLLSAGCGYRRAVLWAAIVEGVTLAGSIFCYYYADSVSMLWLGVLFAHVAGGFLYLTITATRALLRQHSPTARYALHVVVSSLSFISSSLVLVWARL